MDCVKGLRERTGKMLAFKSWTQFTDIFFDPTKTLGSMDNAFALISFGQKMPKLSLRLSVSLSVKVRGDGKDVVFLVTMMWDSSKW